MDLSSLLARIPIAQSAMSKVDDIRAQFLAIPATTQASKSALTYAKSRTNDATEVATLTQLLQKAQTVDSGFQSVLAQFTSFDDLRRSGASAVQLATAAAALAAGAQAVRSQSDALTKAVAPIAQKYGQPVPSSGGGGGVTSGMILLAGVLGLAFVVTRHKGRR